MSTSRIPAVIGALVSTFTSAVGASATVYDGPWLTMPDGDYVSVGWTPDDEASSATQSWAGIGNKARNESIDVPCYVDAYSGDTDTATRRAAVFALLADCENAIRNDPTLGGVVPNPGWAEIGPYSERISQNEAGLAVGVVFHVLVQTRI